MFFLILHSSNSVTVYCFVVDWRCRFGQLPHRPTYPFTQSPPPYYGPSALLCLIVVTACYLFSFNGPLSSVLYCLLYSRQILQVDRDQRSDEPLMGEMLLTHFDFLILLLLRLIPQNNRLGIPINRPETAGGGGGGGEHQWIATGENMGYPKSALPVWQEQLGEADAWY